MLTRIYKPAARKLWECGQKFWITACNMPPDCGLLIDPSHFEGGLFTTFDALVNAFTYYNCNNKCGRYPVFYTAE